MDIDVYVYRNQRAWDRLDALARKRRLTGAEADELVALYERASRQLAQLHTGSVDPTVEAALAALVARARLRVADAPGRIGPDIAHFFTRRFPEALYRAFPWWCAVAALFVTTAVTLGAWISRSEQLRARMGLTGRDYVTKPGGAFETYYFEHPHGAFAAHVWTNNSWVAAGALFTGVLLLPAIYLLVMNAVNVAVTGGLMAHAGRLDTFFAYLLPHGILELTAVFVAGGAGLKLGWTLVDPGRLSRAEAVARQGRETAVIALGLVAVLLVAGFIEGFVTPSGWPTPIRIGIGLLAEIAFLGYVFVLGRPRGTVATTS
ncbi:MAG: stage II sporulation protein M [Mycobacteriaceae bacterium]|nr:stage II sporulation protein M [Mycobacteriaceae bacterium]